MRDSIADLEKLLTTLHEEVSQDRVFLSGLLDHKNATIGWVRERQNNDIALLDDLFEKLLANHKENTDAFNKLYDDMAATLQKEVMLIENHLITYEKGATK